VDKSFALAAGGSGKHDGFSLAARHVRHNKLAAQEHFLEIDSQLAIPFLLGL
jgi:hypothetical protein